MLIAAGAVGPGFCRTVQRLGHHCEKLGERPAPDHRLLHLDARSVLTATDSPRLRQAMERSRRHGAMTSLELGSADWIRARGASRTAFQLAAIRPDLLFAGVEGATELGAPLEGIASIPVLLAGDRCTVHGRQVAGRPDVEVDPEVFTAAFCVALMEGAAPVEAAARAMLLA